MRRCHFVSSPSAASGPLKEGGWLSGSYLLSRATERLIQINIWVNRRHPFSRRAGGEPTEDCHLCQNKDKGQGAGKMKEKKKKEKEEQGEGEKEGEEGEGE